MKRLLLLGLFCLLVSACSEHKETSDWKKSTVHPLQPGATVKLRVVHAINPRLPHLTPGQLNLLLASTQLTAWKHFHVYVEFTEVPEVGIDQIFKLIPQDVMQERLGSIYDFKSGKGDRHALAEGLLTTLNERGTKLEDAMSFAAPYLPEGVHPTDLKSFSEALADVMLKRLDGWKLLKALDGGPVLDASPYNEWVYWDTLGYGDLPYDLVITNQFIASAEYYATDIHSALRGGVSVGTTSFSRNSKFASYIVWSTFPFQDESEQTRLVRGGETYAIADAAELSGAYLAHEVGHLLLQLGHPFGQKSCVMNPVSMLRFNEWFHQIDTEHCLIGSRPEMTLGDIPPVYNERWLKMAEKK